MPRMKHALLIAALLSTLAVFGAACSDDDGPTAESSSTASQSSIDALAAKFASSEQRTSIISLDGLGLHAMSDSLAAGTIDTSFAPKTRLAIRLLALTDWDASLQADAKTVHDHAVDLLAALADEDSPSAAEASELLHDTEHDFSESVWAILAKDLPADAGGVEEHDEDSASGTPAAEGGEGHDEDGETPTAEATP